MIDWDRVSELEDEVGPEDFDEVIQLFLEEVEDRISHLPLATTSADLEATLHFLKGSALNLGFDAFSQLCQSGERSAAIGQSDQVKRQPIIDCFRHSKDTFLSEIKSRQVT